MEAPAVFGYGDTADGRSNPSAGLTHWALTESGDYLWALSATRGELRLFELGTDGVPEHRLSTDVGPADLEQLELADDGHTIYLRTADGLQVWRQAGRSDPPALVQRLEAEMSDFAVVGDFLVTTILGYPGGGPVRIFRRASDNGSLVETDQISYAHNEHASVFYRAGDQGVYVNTSVAAGFSGHRTMRYHWIPIDQTTGKLGTPTLVEFPVPMTDEIDLHVPEGLSQPVYHYWGFSILAADGSGTGTTTDRLLAGVRIAAVAGSMDQRFVYALESETGRIHGYSVAADGGLEAHQVVADDGLWSLEWIRSVLDDQYLLGAMPDVNRWAIYARDKQNGQLTLVKTVSGVDYPGWGLRRVSDVAIAHSGNRVWAITENNTLDTFVRTDAHAPFRWTSTQVADSGARWPNILTSVRVSPDDRFLYLFWQFPHTNDDEIAVYAVDDDSGVPSLIESYNNADFPLSARAVAFSPDWNHLYSGRPIGVLSRDAVTGRLSAGEQYQGRASDIAVSPDGAHVYTVYDEGDVQMRIWTRNSADGSLALSFVVQDDDMSSITLTAAGDEAFTGRAGGFSRWQVDPATGALSDPTHFDSPDGKSVLRIVMPPSEAWLSAIGHRTAYWYARSEDGTLGQPVDAAGAVGTIGAEGRLMARGGMRADKLVSWAPSDRLFIWATDSTFWAPETSPTSVAPPDSPSEDGLHVFPNPTHGRTTLVAGSHQAPVTIEVVDLLGRRVMTRHETSGGPTGLDLSHLAPGMYFIRLVESGGVRVTSVVLDR
ncbi:MAG: beta-propeller fold lactonase family protein [Rhodothermales bacterium]|nr:beta-propeller fold lactonase family protein [Rhodothermales bacterium]MBO6780330.1 beta-propeller fold lactonase family protein [Rhodothermales bacterium]